jgi:hypothetical protein
MAKLSFIDKLNERQTEYANKIAEKAKEMGIPPALAVSIAFHESRLNPDAPRGADGEYGIMQVMPKTGKGMGFTNQDLADPDKNIEAGLKYLKQNLDAFNGDQKMATVGYNAGTNSSFFSGGELPKTTEAYVLAMKGYGAYDTDTAIAQPAEANGDMVAVPKPPEPPAEADMSGADRAAQFLFGGAGATVGTAVAGKGAYDVQKTATAATRAGAEETARIAAHRNAPNAAPPSGPKPPLGSTIMRQPIPSGGPDAGRLAAGQTGTMPYNYAKAAGLTDIEAGRALDMTKQTGGVHDLTTQRREGLNKVQSMFPGEKYVENPRYGGLLTPDQGVGGGPRQSFKVQGALPAADVPPNFMPGPNAPPPAGSLVQLPKPVPIPTTPPPPSMGARVMSGLDSVTDLFKGMMRPITSAVGTVGKYALPPLAGLSAGLDVADIAHEYDKPEDQRDYTKMGLKAASAVGGGLSMFPPAASVGVPLSLGATAAQAYREDPEYFKQKMKEYIGYAP